MNARSRGLTLIELLVVLTILIAISTVALRATEGTVQQSRFENTRTQIEELEAAILGPADARAPDGTPQVTGFVADLGRLPRVAAMAPAGTEFAELTGRGALPLLDLRAADLDSAVQLATGWRGPYLQLGVRTTNALDEVRDGWNNPFQLDLSGTRDIRDLYSQGSDGADGPTAGEFWSEDLEPSISLEARAVDVPLVGGSVLWDNPMGGLERPAQNDGGLPPEDFGDTIYVVIYGPDPSGSGVVVALDHEEIGVTDTSPSGLPTPLSIGASPALATIGPRAVRAYQGPAGLDLTISTPLATQGATLASQVVPLMVRPGGVRVTQDLVLEDLTP